MYSSNTVESKMEWEGVKNVDWGGSGASDTCIPYSRKIWRGTKFGGLAVYITTAKLKSAKISYSHIRMAIPY